MYKRQSFSFSSLEAQSRYKFRIRSRCQGIGQSAWTHGAFWTNAVRASLEGQAELFLFPNPSSGTFSVALNEIENSTVTLTLLNALGQPVLNYEAAVNGQFVKQFDVSELPDGSYYLRLKSGEQQFERTVIIAR